MADWLRRGNQYVVDSRLGGPQPKEVRSVLFGSIIIIIVVIIIIIIILQRIYESSRDAMRAGLRFFDHA